MSAPTLRPYQLGAIQGIEQARINGHTRVLVKSPTGTGKTVTFAELIASSIQGKALVIAHREELLRQSLEKIQAAAPRGSIVAIEQADLYAPRYADVIVASIQTLAARKYARLERLLARGFDPKLVIVDEAHHAAAPSYRTVLAKLGFLPMADASESGETEVATWDDVEKMQKALIGWDSIAPKDKLLVGVTATPNRTDAIGLGCVFQSIAFSYSLPDAIKDGWLVPIKPWVIDTTASLDNVHTARGDFKQNELAEAVNNPERNALAVSAWKAHAAGRQTIAFTVDVQHAHDLAGAFQREGIDAIAISGETEKDVRRDVLSSFTRGQGPTVITNCMVLTEGTDLPIASCILHAKPTKSATLYEQMTGRGLRIYPGKADCVVIDLVDIARKHSLQTAPVLYGLPPNLKTEGEALNVLENELAALREKNPNVDQLLEAGRFTLDEIRRRSKTFDPFLVVDLGALAAVVDLDWLAVGDSYRVSYPWNDGTETLIIEPDVLGRYAIAQTLRVAPQRDGAQWRPGAVRQKTIAMDLPDAATALKTAEEYVRQQRPSVFNLKGKNAKWMDRPATEKQVEYLRKLRIPAPAGVTMGQASRAIDRWKAFNGRA